MRCVPWDLVHLDIEDPWFEQPWGDEPYARICIRKAIHHADTISVNGYGTADLFRSETTKELVILPNGLDVGFADAVDSTSEIPRQLTKGKGKYRVLFTGRIDDRIQFDLLADVLPMVPDIDFYFVGRLQVPREATQGWKRMVKSRHCFHIEPVSYDKIPGLLAASNEALLVALFNHIYIWVHYYTTEKPDMQRIYATAKKAYRRKK